MTNERNLRRTILPNGLTVLTERMEHMRSVAMGVWTKSGSRCEPADINGISHFVEHMLFKGTHSRSAQHIAREMDSIGGNLDAFTGKETICFNVKSLAEHVPIALDVLADLVLNPLFAAPDIERERDVILEEIKIDEDNPDVLVHELFTQSFWQNHPLGKPILGTTASVARLDQKTLFDYHNDRFCGGNMLVSAAGNLDHDHFVEAIGSRFSTLAPGNPIQELGAPDASASIVMRRKKSLEQVQICLGVPSPPITDENRYATLILNTVLGGGMSSRLFQTIREERGMAYSIYSDLSPYRDTGTLCVFAGTSTAKTTEVIKLILAEFCKLQQAPLAPEELKRAKDQLKGGMLMGLESSNSRMANLARQEMYFREFITVEEVIARVDAVTSAEVQAMAQRLFDPRRIAVTLLGRLEGVKLTRAELEC
jgi:predicted Zn-dependent peptidase